MGSGITTLLIPGHNDSDTELPGLWCSGGGAGLVPDRPAPAGRWGPRRDRVVGYGAFLLRHPRPTGPQR